jgi:hypothetical protein
MGSGAMIYSYIASFIKLIQAFKSWLVGGGGYIDMVISETHIYFL